LGGAKKKETGNHAGFNCLNGLLSEPVDFMQAVSARSRGKLAKLYPVSTFIINTGPIQTLNVDVGEKSWTTNQLILPYLKLETEAFLQGILEGELTEGQKVKITAIVRQVIQEVSGGASNQAKTNGLFSQVKEILEVAGASTTLVDFAANWWSSVTAAMRFMGLPF